MTTTAGSFHPENCRSVERSTTAVIDLDAVAHNVSGIRKKVGRKRELMAVVKADGYGHGSVEVSLAALKSEADSLAVALPEEGERLRSAGIDAPILVLGPIQPEEAYKIIRSRLDQTLCSLELADALDQEARKASVRVNVHVKVDTGMGRIGLSPWDVPTFLRKIRQFRSLDVVGIFSHFSSADYADKTFSKKQIEVFDGVI